MTNGEAMAADTRKNDRRSIVAAAPSVPLEEATAIMRDYLVKGSKLISVDAGAVGTTGLR